VIRAVAWLIVAAVGMLAVLLGVALFAAGNPAGTAWLLHRTTTFVPGSLLLEDISGDLISGVSIGSIDYTLPQLRIVATKTTIDIDWPWLIDGRLVFERLTAGKLDLQLLESEEQTDDQPLPAIDLPLVIELNELVMNQIRLSAPGLEETVDDVAGRARLAGNRIQVASLSARRGELTMNLTGELSMAGAYPLGARIRWESSDGSLSGSGSVQGDLDTLAFEHQLNIPDTINLSGVLRSVTRDPNIDATAIWERIELPTGDNGAVILSAGQAVLTGTTSQYLLDLSADVAAPSLPPLAASISAGGNLDYLDISQLSVDGFDGRIVGTGRVRFAEQAISLRLDGRRLNPAAVIDDLPGRLDVRATIEVRLPDHIDANIESVTGTLLDQKLDGRAKLKLSGERLSIARLRLVAGGNQLEFTGDVLPRLAGQFSVDAPDLAGLWPGLRGSVQGSGDVSGTLANPAGRIDLRGSDLFYQDQGLNQLLVDARIEKDQRVDAVIRAAGMVSGTTAIGDLVATTSGTLAAQRVDLELSGGAAGLVINAVGGWNDGELRYRLDAAEIDGGPAGVWRLRNPFDVRAVDSVVRLTAHCWEQAPAELCIGDSLFGSDSLSVDGSLRELPLASFQRWTAEGLNISGTAAAEFNLQRENGIVKGNFLWTQSGTRISFSDSEDTVVETGIDELRLEVGGSDERAQVTGRIRSDLGITVDLDATLTELLAERPGIDGRLRVRAPDIGESTALINRFVAVQKLKGRLDADLRITGSLDAPSIDGDASLDGGSAYLPQTGIDLEDLQLALSGRNGSPLSLNASVRSGGGTLVVEGILALMDQTGPYAELRIRGDNVQVVRFPNQAIYVSPDLKSRIEDGRMFVSGTVFVPNVEILIDTLPESAIAPSEDVVIESATLEKKVRRPPFELVSDVELVIGDNVRFAGFGIDTRLAGSLKLTRAIGAVNSIAEGNLRAVDGRFEAYRKKLTIDRGTLIFAGSLDDPNVDVRASRALTYQGQPITVGVLLSGRLSNMQAKVFSDPAMSEADALSYLVLNRPISRAEGDDAGNLSNAALAFGLSQALPVTQGLQENLGIDEVSLEGTDDESTAIVAGKRISEKVYVRYAYGLFNRIGTFIVRYDLKGGFSIEAGSGEQQTLDLIFTIQR
jgi:translocation and assembly module TamB